jgi:osmotically-inducible protein OsmY
MSTPAVRLAGQPHRWIAAALAASVVAAACATSSSMAPSSPAPNSADERLANGVYQALNADPVYFYRHVDVRVDRGVADLSGYVWSTDAIYHARRVARAVPGVTRVVTNHLELERNGQANGVTR